MSGFLVKFELPEGIKVHEPEVAKPKYTNYEKKILKEINKKFKKK